MLALPNVYYVFTIVRKMDFSCSERRYCVTPKEMQALVYFVKYLRHYLIGKQFTVRMDHGSLHWLMNFKNPEGQVARWLRVLELI